MENILNGYTLHDKSCHVMTNCLRAPPCGVDDVWHLQSDATWTRRANSTAPNICIWLNISDPFMEVHIRIYMSTMYSIYSWYSYPYSWGLFFWHWGSGVIASGSVKQFCRKTCLLGLLIRSIFRRKNCTSASARVQFFQRKIERINRPTRHVLL